MWALLGAAAFILGAVLSAIAMQQPAVARAVPPAAAALVLGAGALQFTTWKARQLACCREASAHGASLATDATAAWRHGLHLGVRCSLCCGNLIALLLVIGVMDLRAMAVVTAAISAERLLPAGERVARAIGALVVGAGCFLLARA